MRIVAVAVIMMVLLVLGGCSSGAEEEMLVSAAASLTDVFGAIEQSFEQTHPDIDMTLNLAGSSALREQIMEGAPVDVFASANTANMDRVVEAGAVTGEPRVFAHNVLQIAVPAGNPAGVRGLDDFADEALLIGLCAVGAPCGDFAREALANAGVVASVDTNEPDVRSLLTKIEAGELDAGITYETDVASSGGAVQGIDIPDDVNVVAEYPIAAVSGAANPDGAGAFIEFVLSDQGRSLLAEFGFTVP